MYEKMYVKHLQLVLFSSYYIFKKKKIEEKERRKMFSSSEVNYCLCGGDLLVNTLGSDRPPSLSNYKHTDSLWIGISSSDTH